MNLTSETKKEAFKKYGKSETDSGSVEGQVALLTQRIKHITGPLKQNKKDFSTLRALNNLVSRRKKLLKYLTNKDINRYREIISELELRR
jgi:small subunit ribosomal protein S15